MAAGRWAGKGDKESGDKAAVDQMRLLLGTVPFRGVVVIGEGEKDEAPMLHNGEEVGDGTGPEFDVAVDPVDGTTLLAKGMPNALAMIAIAERGAMFNPKDVFYMDKIVVGPRPSTRSTSSAPARGQHPRRGQGSGQERPRTSPSASWTGRATASSSHRCEPPAPGSSSSATATSPARSWRPARTSAWTSPWESAGRPRASSPPAPCAPWAGRSRPSCGSPTTSRGNAPSTPATTSTGS